MNPIENPAGGNGKNGENAGNVENRNQRPSALASFLSCWRANFWARNNTPNEPLPHPMRPADIVPEPDRPDLPMPPAPVIHRRAASNRVPDAIIDLSGADEEMPGLVDPRMNIADMIFGDGPDEIDNVINVRRSERIAQLLIRNTALEAEVESLRQGIRRQQEENGVAALDPNEAAPPRKRSRQENNDADNVAYFCPICNCGVSERTPVVTKCGHIFCRECLDKSLQITKKCPFCNGRVREGGYFRVYL